MAEQPDSLVLEILRGLRADIADVKSDVNSLRADVASDLLNVGKEIAEHRKETREQIAGVRRALIEYHSSVVGHGIQISEL